MTYLFIYLYRKPGMGLKIGKQNDDYFRIGKSKITDAQCFDRRYTKYFFFFFTKGDGSNFTLLNAFYENIEFIDS